MHVHLCHQLLFESAFDDAPKCLNRVEFWRVGWLKGQLEVVMFTVLAHDKSVMGSVVVQDDVDRGRCFTSWERLANLSDKRMEVGGIGCLSEHEEWFREKFADSPNHSDASVTSLVQHEFDRLLVGCPSPLAVHPTVETSLVDVNQHFLLLNEGGELDRKLPPLLLLLQHHALLVRVRADEVLDAVSAVKRAEARDRKFHSHLPLELLAPLMQGEPTPTLEGLMSPEVSCNISLDFEGGLGATVGSPIMNVVGALPNETLDCVVAGGDWNVHDFRQLGVSHEVCGKVS